MKKESNFQSIP